MGPEGSMSGWSRGYRGPPSGNTGDHHWKKPGDHHQGSLGATPGKAGEQPGGPRGSPPGGDPTILRAGRITVMVS